MKKTWKAPSFGGIKHYVIDLFAWYGIWSLTSVTNWFGIHLVMASIWGSSETNSDFLENQDEF